jgi:hypothetical protein
MPISKTYQFVGRHEIKRYKYLPLQTSSRRTVLVPPSWRRLRTLGRGDVPPAWPLTCPIV